MAARTQLHKINMKCDASECDRLKSLLAFFEIIKKIYKLVYLLDKENEGSE